MADLLNGLLGGVVGKLQDQMQAGANKELQQQGDEITRERVAHNFVDKHPGSVIGHPLADGSNPPNIGFKVNAVVANAAHVNVPITAYVTVTPDHTSVQIDPDNTGYKTVTAWANHALTVTAPDGKTTPIPNAPLADEIANIGRAAVADKSRGLPILLAENANRLVYDAAAVIQAPATTPKGAAPPAQIKK